ncbi:TPA: glycosyltransferase, partial [Shigella sonnei]
YCNSPLKYEENKNPVYEYMTFLSNNNLSYGYGSFWYSMNMTVNWLSKDQIHITPVFFNPETGVVYFQPARIQTLSSWHTKEFISGKPNRQFIAITQGQTGGDTCPNVQICIDGAQKQLGKADEILSYKNTTFLVYNKPIETDIK